MAWKLIEVPKTEWKQDNSRYLSYIYSIGPCKVRLDLMIDIQEPVISFQGRADDVRKAAMQYIDENCICISAEHAAYIGSELTKAEVLEENYVQS